jgi:hypothetical protein
METSLNLFHHHVSKPMDLSSPKSLVKKSVNWLSIGQYVNTESLYSLRILEVIRVSLHSAPRFLHDVYTTIRLCNTCETVFHQFDGNTFLDHTYLLL